MPSLFSRSCFNFCSKSFNYFRMVTVISTSDFLAFMYSRHRCISHLYLRTRYIMATTTVEHLFLYETTKHEQYLFEASSMNSKRSLQSLSFNFNLCSDQSRRFKYLILPNKLELYSLSYYIISYTSQLFSKLGSNTFNIISG